MTYHSSTTIDLPLTGELDKVGSSHDFQNLRYAVLEVLANRP
jgi:hypothetical protein